jgi:hypothetical protein
VTTSIKSLPRNTSGRPTLAFTISDLCASKVSAANPASAPSLTGSRRARNSRISKMTGPTRTTIEFPVDYRILLQYRGVR